MFKSFYLAKKKLKPAKSIKSSNNRYMHQFAKISAKHLTQFIITIFNKTFRIKYINLLLFITILTKKKDENYILNN